MYISMNTFIFGSPLALNARRGAVIRTQTKTNIIGVISNEIFPLLSYQLERK